MEYADDAIEGPRYRSAKDIGPRELPKALTSLQLFEKDHYLRAQANHLGIVDHFITDLEYGVMRKLFATESTPPETAFLSAQSQMWLFAAYELLRTWHQRAREMVKWANNGGLELKLKALKENDPGYLHFGRQVRIRQLELVLEDPSIIAMIKTDIRHLHIPYVRLEYLRVSLAKHEVSGRNGSAALMPGYGRINSWCGSIDYEIENGQYSMGFISRRDVADSIRALDLTTEPPTADALQDFDDYMAGKARSD